jgi:hypothetical protein
MFGATQKKIYMSSTESLRLLNKWFPECQGVFTMDHLADKQVVLEQDCRTKMALVSHVLSPFIYPIQPSMRPYLRDDMSWPNGVIHQFRSDACDCVFEQRRPVYSSHCMKKWQAWLESMPNLYKYNF